jgi:hypothetical protein
MGLLVQVGLQDLVALQGLWPLLLPEILAFLVALLSLGYLKVHCPQVVLVVR